MNREINTNHTYKWARGLTAAFALAIGLGIAFPADAKKNQKSKTKPTPTAKSIILVPPVSYHRCGAEYVADAITGQILHNHNADAPVLPASVSKLPLALAVDAAIKAKQTTWNTEIDIPRPAPVATKKAQKDAAKPKINATICDENEIGTHGTIRMTVRDAVENTLVASNLQTSVGLARHLEQITGQNYAQLMGPFLSALGSDHSSIIEPSGISNAARCLNERRGPADYAAALKDIVAKGTPINALKQNISTVKDMGRWAWEAIKIPELLDMLRKPVTTFMNANFSNTNPLMRGPQHHSDSPGKTGFTVTAGGTFAGTPGLGPLMISVAACDNTRHRDARLEALNEEFLTRTRQIIPSPHLDNVGQISHSHTAPSPDGPAPMAE